MATSPTVVGLRKRVRLGMASTNGSPGSAHRVNVAKQGESSAFAFDAELQQVSGETDEEKREISPRTLPAISKLDMGRLLGSAEGIEHLVPVTPEAEGEEDA